MRHIVFVFSLVLTFVAHAQPNTNSGFISIKNINGAREGALSGMVRAVYDGDLSLALKNPTILNDKTNGAATFTVNPWFEGITSGNAAYAFQYKQFHLVPAISFFSYGTFDGRDNLGNESNTFSARDLQLSLGAGYKINERISVGATYKFVNSKYESQGSSFMGIDLMGSIINEEKLFMLTAGIENMGVVLSQFDGEERSAPSNLYISLSKKLDKAPFRFYLTLDQLNRWDIIPEDLYNEPSNAFGQQEQVAEPGFGKQLFFHTKLATELVMTKNFHIRLGYNYQRREELKLTEKPGMSGFSYGFEFKVNRFRFAYARARYHQAFANNYFTISTNINKFK
jgi:hypothetical protein